MFATKKDFEREFFQDMVKTNYNFGDCLCSAARDHGTGRQIKFAA